MYKNTSADNREFVSIAQKQKSKSKQWFLLVTLLKKVKEMRGGFAKNTTTVNIWRFKKVILAPKLPFYAITRREIIAPIAFVDKRKVFLS